MEIGDVVRLKKGTEYKKSIDEIYGLFYYYGVIRQIFISMDDGSYLVRAYFNTPHTELTCDESNFEVVEVHKHDWIDDLLYRYLCE